MDTNRNPRSHDDSNGDEYDDPFDDIDGTGEQYPDPDIDRDPDPDPNPIINFDGDTYRD